MNSEVGFFDVKPFHPSLEKSTSFNIREIKTLLLSGDQDRTLQAIESIKHYLGNDELTKSLISSDISEFLCDAMTPLEPMTCREIFWCLEHLVQHVEFFTQNHSSLVVEALIRSIHFLLKNTTTIMILTDCLILLELITEGYNKFNVMPEKENIENILQVLPILINSSAMTINNKHQIGSIILSLTELNLSFWTDNLYLMMMEVISDWMSVADEIFHLDHPLKERLIFLTSYICHFVLKAIISSLNSSNVFSTEMYEKNKDDLIIKIINFLIDFEAPYLDTLPVSFIQSEPVKIETFFQILLCFYLEDVFPEKVALTHGLSEVGFLQFATRVISFADFGNSEHLRKLGVCVLSHVILVLSEDVFQVSKIWSESQEYFRCEIQKGFSQLPPDASQWLDFMIDPESPNVCKISLLFYLYFYCLTSKSQSILGTIYPSISTLLNFSTGLEYSPLLVKVVWFVYVMSKLSASLNQLSEIEAEETNKMVSMLQLQDNLELVYTHHPALLYWAFSSEVTSNIQLKIVNLWLRNKSSNCTEIEDLIEKSSDVRFAILDILQNDNGDVLDSAFLTLNSVLAESGDDNLITNLWFLLPQMLSKYAADSATAKNVDYVIELCSLRTPENLDSTQMMRIANLLPEVFINSDLISVVPSLTLALRLLEFATNENDSRIMRTFLRVNAFSEKLIEGIESNVQEIGLISLKVLTFLWRNGNRCYKSKRVVRISIKKEVILGTLTNSHVQVLEAALELLQEILLTGFSSNVFDIVDFDMNFVEILFFEVENIFCKGLPVVSSTCWSCLKSFILLDSSFRGNFSKLQLSSDPLLHEVINYHLEQLQETKEMKNFLDVWIEKNDSVLNSGLFRRKIFGQFFSETVDDIIGQFGKNLRNEDEPLYEKILHSVYTEES